MRLMNMEMVVPLIKLYSSYEARFDSMRFISTGIWSSDGIFMQIS